MSTSVLYSFDEAFKTIVVAHGGSGTNTGEMGWKPKKPKGKKKKSGGKTRVAGGTHTVRVTNKSGKKLFLRVFKVNETIVPGSKAVDSVIKPLSNIIVIDASNTRPVPVVYEALTWTEAFTPGLRVHLYWSTCQSDMLADQPFGGDPQHFDRDHQRILTTDINLDPIVNVEACVTAPTASETVASAPASGGGKNSGNKKKGHYRGVFRYEYDVSNLKYNKKSNTISRRSSPSSSTQGSALVKEIFGSESLMNY